MKKTFNIFIVLLLVMFCYTANAQEANKFGTYYNQRLSHFKALPNDKGELIFLGNSITDGAEWSELFKNKKIKNRGISGDTTEGVLYRLDEVTESNPKKIFLLIGTNDLSKDIKPEIVLENIKEIANKIRSSSPKTKVFIQSILPVNPAFEKFKSHTNRTEDIIWVNTKLQEWCNASNITFIDLFSVFIEQKSQFMNPVFTNDGLHLLGEGYTLWHKTIKQYL